MSARSTIGLLAVLFLLGGIVFLVFAVFEMATVGHATATLPAALACIMFSVVSSTVFNAFSQLEARLKALEERLAKCERGPAAP